MVWFSPFAAQAARHPWSTCPRLEISGRCRFCPNTPTPCWGSELDHDRKATQLKKGEVHWAGLPSDCIRTPKKHPTRGRLEHSWLHSLLYSFETPHMRSPRAGMSEPVTLIMASPLDHLLSTPLVAADHTHVATCYITEQVQNTRSASVSGGTFSVLFRGYILCPHLIAGPAPSCPGPSSSSGSILEITHGPTEHTQKALNLGIAISLNIRNQNIGQRTCIGHVPARDLTSFFP